jgi:HK97 family phage portal protein
LHGNAYAEIQWQGPDMPAYLWPIPAQLVEARRTDDPRTAKGGGVEYLLPSLKIKIAPENMIHIKGFTLDGLTGLSKITSAARTVSLADSTESYGDNFFANGGMPSGVLKMPAGQRLSPDSAKRLRESWNASYGTLTNSQRVAVLEDGVEFAPVTISPKDVQFLEVRRFSAGQIAALFGVPARLVGANDGPVGWGSVEQETLEWTQFGLTPDLVQAEQEIRYKLLGGSGAYYAKFNLDGLLRADIKTRMEAHAIAWQHGALTVDEWRAMEEMGPVATDGGRRFVPANFVPADRIDDLIDARVQPTAPPGSPAQ